MIHAWWAKTQYIDHILWENIAFIEWCKEKAEACEAHCKDIPYKEWNVYPSNKTEFSYKTLFVVHFSGLKMIRRFNSNDKFFSKPITDYYSRNFQLDAETREIILPEFKVPKRFNQSLFMRNGLRIIRISKLLSTEHKGREMKD